MDYRAYARQMAQQHGLDPNLVEATMFAESNGNPNAVSPKGATGLMQLMPETAKELGVDPRDPYQNIEGGVRYLKQQIDKHGVVGGLAAYNAGPGAYTKTGGDFNALPNETKAYVPKVMNRAAQIAQGGPMNQQSTGPSIGQMQRALEKAKAANDQAAVTEISGLLQSKYQAALQKATAANDQAAVQEITAAIQGFAKAPQAPAKAQPVPVAPPVAVPGAPIAPPPAAVVPSEAPAPAPAPAPEAPVEQPVAAPEVTPEAPPAPPAPRTTADIVAGRPASPAKPAEAPKAKLTDEAMNTDPTWINNAKRIYKDVEHKEFSGSDAEAADWLKNYVAQTKWNLGSSLGTMIDAAANMSPGSKQALLESIEAYDEAPISWESVGRGLKGIATDPTTYLTGGVGSLFTKTIGKKAAQEGLKQALEAGLKKTIGEKALQTVTGATAKTAATGATYGALNNLSEQGVQIAADGQESIDTGKLAKAAGIGAGAGVGINKVLEKVTGRAAVKEFGKRAGSETNAAMDAEIIRDLNDIADSASKVRGSSSRELQAIDANDLARKYLSQAEEAINKLDPQAREPLTSALKNGRALNAEERAAVTNTPGGADVLNIVDKADRVRTLTGQMGAKGGVLGTVARQGVNLSPAYVSALLGYPVPVTVDMLKAITNKMGGKTTRADAIADTLKIPNVRAANAVNEILGPSPATQSMDQLREMASKAVVDRAARVEAAKQARATATKAADNPNAAISELQGKDPTYLLGLGNQFGAPRNSTEMEEFSKVIRLQMEARAAKEKLAKEAAAQKAQSAKGITPEAERNAILEANRMPLGGPFQELLAGGRSGLNLTTDQAIDALRLVSAKNKANPLGTAADQIRRSSPDGVTNTDAFYGVQNEIRKLQERGVLGGQPGALSAPTTNPVRNPISYAANVRTAEAALKQATSSAPNNALAQFANVVAAAKSPEAKAKLLEQRLMKTTDPAEIQFLTDFIEPLTRFGAKSK